MSDDWVKGLDKNTPAAQLPLIAAEWSAFYIEQFRAQLARDPELTDAERKVMLLCSRPFIRMKTREAIDAAWTDLQRVQ